MIEEHDRCEDRRKRVDLEQELPPRLENPPHFAEDLLGIHHVINHVDAYDEVRNAILHRQRFSDGSGIKRVAAGAWPFVVLAQQRVGAQLDRSILEEVSDDAVRPASDLDDSPRLGQILCADKFRYNIPPIGRE